ncbi:MT-A70-domain-containing protein [Ampelomyces quisqualis]|uniref:MT-A70-domain-containing protein n=1 Tax=Ampelomyces quisqualis TaxID=50730 RepID=A0A6A5Q7I7_AMPQU|nr:MT-A70-domain-containing protein [Ampelomyces quisqualis]
MAAQLAPRSSILYQNTARTVALIDIPTSIATAQGRTDILLSTPPLEAPIEPKEDYQPKSQKAKANNAHNSPDGAQHAEYKYLIEPALAVIRANVSGTWCSPRRFLDSRPPHGTTMDVDDPETDLESRLRQWAAWKGRKADDAAFDLQKMMASLGATYDHNPTAKQNVAPRWAMSYRPAREAVSGAHVAETVPRNEPKESWTSSFHNPEAHALELEISERSSVQDTPPGPRYRFRIPPRSTFFLSDFTHSDAFRASFRDLTDEFTLPRHFDLVLLDPPWPNRSAKRKQGTYEQVGGMPYLKKMLLKMDLDSYLEHNALVGIWITNKSTLREHVLGSGGLFETWNVGLIEEWVWIKTTTEGEPMFDIDSAMRKPYEVLLLGRAAPNSWTCMIHAPNIKRRVIAAVPDIHSRKPCLKELLEECLPDPTDYSALEVFSRYLVSGWTSWGNEVLKYNWDHYWAKEESGATAREHQLPIRSI